MAIIAGSRHAEILDVAHGACKGGVADAIVVNPGPELQSMCIGEGVPVAGITLQTELEFRLETELLRDRNLPSQILEEPWNWANGLGQQAPHANQQQRAACTEPGQLSFPHASPLWRWALIAVP
jgi:hypothetical protein